MICKKKLWTIYYQIGSFQADNYLTDEFKVQTFLTFTCRIEKQTVSYLSISFNVRYQLFKKKRKQIFIPTDIQAGIFIVGVKRFAQKKSDERRTKSLIYHFQCSVFSVRYAVCCEQDYCLPNVVILGGSISQECHNESNQHCAVEQYSEVFTVKCAVQHSV